MQQENQLQQVIDLIEKTGDKAVVLEQGRPAYVVMRLKDYEELILAKSGVQGLTKEEMQDKINREIAIWKSDQERMEEILEQGEESGEDFDSLEDWEEDWERDRDWARERVGARGDRERERDWEEEVPFRPFAEPGEEDERRRALDIPDFSEEEDDEFDIDKEIRNIERERKDEKSRFEEDRFYVEPV